jgi:hypothetical protein
MTFDEILPLFSGPDGAYHFARWRRPIAPVVFGVSDETLGVVRGAIAAVAGLAGHPLAETDPEQGANLMIFFFRDWAELLAVPDLGALVPGLPDLVGRLQAEGADQYRHFRFEADGAIRACFAFLRVDGPLAEMAAADLALMLAVQVMLLWSDRAFRDRAPLGRAGGVAVLRPEYAVLIRVAYDPRLPDVAHDASHALRLAARVLSMLQEPH